MNRLNNKIALITGAASGIGQATARLFHAQGALVILTDINDIAGQALAHSLGARAYYQHLDVSQEQQWQALAAWIKQQWGRLDVLFNNAGIMGFDPQFGPQDPEHCSLLTWQQIHHINLDSVFLGCRYGIELMKDQHAGSIVNMSSRSGLVGVPGAAAYASSKAAIRNHTKSVALYCAQQGYNIRCNSLHPATILTPLWDPMLGVGEDRAAKLAAMARGVPLHRMGTPEDVAYAALYFASDESSYVTGSELIIDGGILAGSTAAPEK